jgi:hypothetical protein
MGRLREIQEQMLELLEEAKGIVSKKRKSHRMTYDRMKAYWHGHIQMALTDEHGYVGSDGATMLEAVNDIEGEGDSAVDLIAYADGAEVEAEALRLATKDDDIKEGQTVSEIIHYLVEQGEEADTIREYIDKACETE